MESQIPTRSETFQPPAPETSAHRGPEAYLRSNLTVRQFRFWMLQSAHPELPIERFLRVIRIPAHFAAHLEAAWKWFSTAADATRARLVVEGGVPRLGFETAAEPLQFHQLGDIADPAAAAFEWSERIDWTRFNAGDLQHRHALLTLKDGGTLWAFTANHLASDGRSGNVIFRVMVEGMTALSRGETLPPLSLPSFEKNMAAERAREHPGLIGASAGRFDDVRENLQAPFSLFGLQNNSRSVRRPVGTQSFSSAWVERLQALCRHDGFFHRSVEVTTTNLFTALAAIWAWRHGGPRQQVIGVPFHGRSADELDLIGFKSETLPIRIEVDPDQSFPMLLRAVHDEVRGCLQRRGQSVANPLHAPVFRVFAGNSWQAKAPQAKDGGLAWLQVEKLSGTPEFVNLTLVNTDDGGDGMNLVVRVTEEIAEHTDPRWLAAGFETAINALMAQPDLAVRDVPFVDAGSQALISALAHVRVRQADTRWISAWTRRLPVIGTREALIHGDERMTHAELAATAGRWRAYLAGQGLLAGDRVVVWAPTSNILTAAWLALMAAGGVHVPVHHTTPMSRVRELVAKLGARWVLHATDIEVPDLPPAVRCLPLEPSALAAVEPAVLEDPDPDALAHIFHTSGSTGDAKPIMVSHRSLAASIRGWIDANQMAAGERIFHFYSITFDPWLTGIMPALWLAGTCVTHDQPRPPAADALYALLDRHRISCLCTPTAYFHALHDAPVPPTLARWIVGGEALAADKAMRFLNARGRDVRTRLVNAYGPTETTIWASVVEVNPGHHGGVPLGRPVPTCGFRIVDESGNTAPFGVPGELWITGPQVAAGYFGQPDLTARQFVNADGQRWYRTGDVVRLRKDGDLQFLGRVDRQVQIRGYRVEPGEIEIALRALAGIRDAVVVPVDTLSTTTLCAYVIGAANRPPIEAQSVRLELLRVLPEYKVPRWIVQVDAFPANSNGKVDVTALPAPSRAAGDAGADRLPTLTLWDLRFAFEEVLGLPRIGIDEDFFSLGGDSLQLVELIAAIERRFGRTLEPVDIIRHPTIGGLAPLLESGRSHHGSLVVELSGGSRSPLFCIPGAGGIGVEFYPLARRLPKGQPVIVLRSSGTDGHTRPPDSVHALLCEHELHLLAWRERHGDATPVQLMGYSLGGIFAYELAQRLRSRGIPVARVFLIDAHIATDAGRALHAVPGPSLRGRLKSLLKGQPADRELSILQAELERSRSSGRIMDAARLGRLNLLCQARLAREIHATAADFPVTYFLAVNGPRRGHATLWQQLVADFSLQEIEGDHHGDDAIVREPRVEALATALLPMLRP